MSIVDISLSLNSNLPAWPGSPGFKLCWSKQLNRGATSNNSEIISDSHAGTHLDAPLHFIPDGSPVDRLSLDTLIGPCRVVHLPRVKKITAEILSELNLPKNEQRVLFRTDNSKLWSEKRIDFKKDFVALDAGAANWVVRHRIRLIGIDYLSIGSFHGGVKTHQILLEAGIIVLEGLNLSRVEPGEFELICLPMKISGAEGAPARAVLRKPN